MPNRSFPARIKAAPSTSDGGDGGGGQFDAIVSVFGNRDSWGDVVQPGAFTETLAEWKASGDPIPVLWSHRMDDPRFNIGVVSEARELEPGAAEIPEWAGEAVKAGGGLWVRGQLDTGEDATDVATTTRRLMLARRVTQFSFAYDVLDAGWGEVDGQETYELRRLKLYETSVTPVGANDQTTLIDAKHDPARLHLALTGAQAALRDLTRPSKAGRVLSSKNESSIRDAVALLEGVLSSLDEGKASAAANLSAGSLALLTEVMQMETALA